MLGPHPSLALPGAVAEMGKRTLPMVNRTLTALNDGNANLARALCLEDVDIDALYDRAYQEFGSGPGAAEKSSADASADAAWGWAPEPGRWCATRGSRR